MSIPKELRYSEDHEWIKVDGNKARIGITAFAQSELGDIVFVDLKPVGTKMKQGERFGTVEAVKAVSDLYSPITGEITELNPMLEKSPEIVNKEPYSGGWMVKMKIANTIEVGSLLDAKKYRELIGK